MTEKEKENKEEVRVEEKRIKPSVIRRRSTRIVKEEPEAAKPAKAKAEAGVSKKEEKKAEKAPEKKAAPSAKKTAAAPKKEAKAKEPAKTAETKTAATKSTAVWKKAAAKSAPEPAAEKKPAEAKQKAPARKEVKVFEKEKERELKKFFTSHQPYRKGKRHRERHHRVQPAPNVVRPIKKTEKTTPKAAKRIIKIEDAISIADLSQRLGVKSSEIIKKLMGLGMMVTVNQFIDADSAALVAQDYGYDVENVAVQEEALVGTGSEAEQGELAPRAPVVTVMGHVDHGKTSLLDAIRETNVVEGEAGGITQHIGAYHVHLDKGDITFLDTPGHEAFTAMRARGAKATDIVVLVVAADDGVMPQTVEAINHAKAAGVPIIVAINKIDKPGAEPERIKQALTEYGLVPEEWGGDTIFVEVSAKKRINIKELLEMILLQAEMLELKANYSAPARGTIIEAKLDKGRGPVATVLIQNGTLRTGDAFVTGLHYGRVRAMISDWGKRINEAGPSMPVEILGLSGVPEAGDSFIVVKDEATAKQVAAIRQRKAAEKERMKTAKVSLSDLYEKISSGEVKELNLIIKADVHGSIEAIKDALSKIKTDAIKLNVIHSAVGGIIEGDVMLASASNAIIIGFNVRPESKARALAEKEKVDIRLYDVIYDLTEDIKKAMEGLLEPVIKEEVTGRAEVREVFRISKVGNVAGCYILEGKALRGSRVRLIRDNVVIYDGKLSSLKRFKDDVKEVAAGYECGMTIEGYNDIKVGDIIELYTLKEEAARL